MLAARDLEIARDITDRLLAATDRRANRILLHGSRVSGRARPTSDFDVLVVLPDPVEDWVSESMRLLDLFNDFPWAVDIHVFGEAEYQELRHIPGALPYPASTHGVVLYETAS